MSSFLSLYCRANARLATQNSRLRALGRRTLFTAVSILKLSLLLSPVQAVASENIDTHCHPAPAPAFGSTNSQYDSTKSKAILGKRMSALEKIQASQNRSLSGQSRQTRVEKCFAHSAIGIETTIASESLSSNIVVNQELIAQALTNLRTKARLAFRVPADSAPQMTSVKQWAVSAHPVFAPNNVVEQAPLRTLVRQRRVGNKVKHRHSEKPDIFGTVALPVSRTPLDWKWNGARLHGSNRGARSALAAAGGKVGTQHRENNIHAVNQWVNKKVSYVEDRKLYGTADHWASVSKTLKLGRGDCEDFAIAKMQILQASGIKSSDMFLVIAKDLVRRSDHALLVVRVEDRLLVLDNETDKILDAENVRDYRPVMSYSGTKKWLHGYPAKPRNTQMASLTTGG